MTVALDSGRPRFAERHPRFAGASIVWCAAVGAGLFGFAAALFGPKGAIAGVAFALLAALLICVPWREEALLGVTVLSFGAVMHKSFGPLEPISSGPVSIYLNSIDVMVLALWVAWFVSDPYGMLPDLRRAFRRPVMWLPIVGFWLMMPSVVVAPSLSLALAEITRMFFLYLLFVYFAVRVRSRAQVWVALGALGVLAIVESVIVAGQYVTKGSLGLSFLGTPDELNQRITDTGSIGRPFGTIIHPVFMAAFLGPLALIGLSLAINLRTTWLRRAALVASAAAMLPMVLSHTRAGALGAVGAGAVLCAALLGAKRLTWRAVRVTLVIALGAVIVFWPQINSLYQENFQTEHFGEEVDSRGELNSLATRMIEARPDVGHGLNNFEQVMGRYNKFGLIFDDNPVHNLFLLQWSETGILGLAGLGLVGGGLFVVAFRLSRSKDRLYSALGWGVAATYLFFVIEEMFVFSLRLDQPRSLFWMIAGISVAATQLAFGDPPVRRRPPRRRPTHPGAKAAGNGSGKVHATGSSPLVGSARHARMRFAPTSAAAVAEPIVPADLLPRRAGVLPQRAGVSPQRAGVLPRRGRARALETGIARRTRLDRRRRRLTRVRAAFLGGLLLGGPLFLTSSVASGASNLSQLKITFAATDRATGHRAIFTVNGDGSGLTRITPNDFGDYSWPTFAYGGSHIVFTGRHGPVGSPEQVYLMRSDGSDVRALTSTRWRNAQPQISRDGRAMVFSSQWSEYPLAGVYRMDLDTQLVTNLSAAGSEAGAIDSDPRWTPDGTRVVLASSATGSEGRPGQIVMTDADGRNRVDLTNNRFYNTDPEVSPDGSRLTISRYVGEGTPRDPNSVDEFQVKLYDFRLIVRDLAEGGAERELTAGERCFERTIAESCSPEQGPAYVPRWTPDGSGLGFVSVLSNVESCVCFIDADGGNPRRVVSSVQLAINWFDWVLPSDAPDVTAQIGSRSPADRLLFGGRGPDDRLLVEASLPDRFGELPVLPDLPVQPLNARWSADREQVVFSALVPYDVNRPQIPDPPPGDFRHRHYTLSWMSEFYFPAFERALAPLEQVFIVNTDGTGLRQLTTPWTEDHLDAIPDGEVRGNADPDISPDGRYVVFTNISTATRESFIVRLDLLTGEVFNLTNATSGALPVSDLHPRYSPDGSRIAFATTVGGNLQIATIDARDGSDYRELTDDDYVNLSPAWSPDGGSLVYASYRGGGAIQTSQSNLALAAQQGEIASEGWVLVRVDLAGDALVGGSARTLTGPEDSPVFGPTWSPDGTTIAFISLSGPPLQPDIHVVPAGGGVVRPLQVTLVTDEFWLDWR